MSLDKREERIAEKPEGRLAELRESSEGVDKKLTALNEAKAWLEGALERRAANGLSTAAMEEELVYIREQRARAEEERAHLEEQQTQVEAALAHMEPESLEVKDREEQVEARLETEKAELTEQSDELYEELAGLNSEGALWEEAKEERLAHGLSTVAAEGALAYIQEARSDVERDRADVADSQLDVDVGLTALGPESPDLPERLEQIHANLEERKTELAEQADALSEELEKLDSDTAWKEDQEADRAANGDLTGEVQERLAYMEEERSQVLEEQHYVEERQSEVDEALGQWGE
jgi:uncharacterized phage infection (PIP) family protein YhgE